MCHTHLLTGVESSHRAATELTVQQVVGLWGAEKGGQDGEEECEASKLFSYEVVQP